MVVKLRHSNGQSLAELCAGLIVCVPIILCCIDAAFIALGASTNDSVCREAARAASSGKPGPVNPVRHLMSSGQSFDRASAVIKMHNPTTMPIKVDARPMVFEQVRDVPPTNMGGAVDGEVEVQTRVVIAPPFLLRALLPAGVNLTATHSMPFTYSVRQKAKP